MFSIRLLTHWTCLILLCFDNNFVHAIYISKNDISATSSPLELNKRSSHFHSKPPDSPLIESEDGKNSIKRKSKRESKRPEVPAYDPETTSDSNLHSELKRTKSLLPRSSKNVEHKLETRDFGGYPGTNKNAPGVKPIASNGFSLASNQISVRSNMGDIRSQPAAFYDKCTGVLDFESCLGGELGFQMKGIFLPTGRKLESQHVKQGNIGDCGMGAAFKALVLTGYEYNLRSKFQNYGKFPKAAPGWENTVVLMGMFYRVSGAKQVVIIDDGLPETCEGHFLGHRPATTENVLFFPYLEKAIAKYVDAYPEEFRWGGYSEDWGYLGIEGISGGKVLEMLIGGTFRSATRSNVKSRSGNSDVSFIDNFRSCIKNNIPCVAGTPGFRTLDEKQKTTALHLNGFPTDRTYLDNKNKAMGGMRATLVAGWTIENIPTIPSKRLGLLVRLWNKATSTEVVLVDNHAYAITKSDKGSDMVMISNPWSCNPSATTENDCPGDGVYHIPVKVAAAVFSILEWVS